MQHSQVWTEEAWLTIEWQQGFCIFTLTFNPPQRAYRSVFVVIFINSLVLTSHFYIVFVYLEHMFVYVCVCGGAYACFLKQRSKT